jgi:hypothetical protein
MHLSVDENPNCETLDPRVYQERTRPRVVTAVLRSRGGQEVWCSVVAMDAGGKTGPAQACKVEDSGEGTCYLVYGGRWGIRLKDPACHDDWHIPESHQWGEPFLLLSADGADLKFDA